MKSLRTLSEEGRYLFCHERKTEKYVIPTGNQPHTVGL